MKIKHYGYCRMMTAKELGKYLKMGEIRLCLKPHRG
jgi:hypothetical protein